MSAARKEGRRAARRFEFPVKKINVYTGGEPLCLHVRRILKREHRFTQLCSPVGVECNLNEEAPLFDT